MFDITSALSCVVCHRRQSFQLFLVATSNYDAIHASISSILAKKVTD